MAQSNNKKVRHITDKGYQNYIKAFNKKIDMLKKHNVAEELLPKALDKKRWELNYTIQRRDNLELVKLGKLK